MSVLVHGFDDCQHLLVINLVILLCEVELSTVERDRVKAAIGGVALGYDGSQGIIGGVCLDDGG